MPHFYIHIFNYTTTYKLQLYKLSMSCIQTHKLQTNILHKYSVYMYTNDYWYNYIPHREPHTEVYLRHPSPQEQAIHELLTHTEG